MATILRQFDNISGCTKPRNGSWGDEPRLSKLPLPDTCLTRSSDVFDVTMNPSTMFRYFFDRDSLPIRIRQNRHLELEWTVDLEVVDVDGYLPLFIDGIRERTDPYLFVAREGSFDLIEIGSPESIVESMHATVVSLKAALDTHCFSTICLALEIIQKLTTRCPEIAFAMVPYYRKLLPVLNRFKSHKRNMGDRMDFAQNSKDGRLIGEKIEETLSLLHETGGPSAFAAIKSIVPTFEVVN